MSFTVHSAVGLHCLSHHLAAGRLFRTVSCACFSARAQDPCTRSYPASTRLRIKMTNSMTINRPLEMKLRPGTTSRNQVHGCQQRRETSCYVKLHKLRVTSPGTKPSTWETCSNANLNTSGASSKTEGGPDSSNSPLLSCAVVA